MDVDQLLRESQQKAEALKKRVQVQRTEEYYVDEGNMFGADPRPVDLHKFNSEAGREEMKETARENVQLLFNAIWKLPMENDDEGRFAVLPPPKMRLPRQKPAPEQREKTRWERFAELKGIKKTKRSRMLYDEMSGEWRPRWGYKRANDAAAVPWIEVKEGSDPYEDQYEKLKKDKKARVEKNEQQRLKNIAAARLKAKGIPANRHLIQKELKKAIAIGRSSTASAGVFDKDLPGEAKIKKQGKRTKVSRAGDRAGEGRRTEQ
ncbi:ribosome biogenesis protein Rrs1 [Salpingoeca rosetta]|uniref:Ribosome biogenesis regulatory protein n=1 Tax=Salpingoeca rosetta (strain ATCC 50818 / BSB-021) TaxID=946362 RepID=F2TWF3_SALR5|nr:ribosome biogenesis protein Rrs1 [Salpingoeca rosetta]EGD72399.1 ribosome biogenesis protein Rrs1 [Salpingoeca rosetta]|eukprot:XP_004998968.1 ribosome biogenesis protein Rrs1 [Salpingoeca rosetta]